MPDWAIPQDKGHYVEEIRDGLYWMTKGVYTTIFLTTGEAVIVDAPPNFGDKLLKAVAEVTDEPIIHVIYSHSYADHIAGAGKYPTTATYIAHKATEAAPRRPEPHHAVQCLHGCGSFVPLDWDRLVSRLDLHAASAPTSDVRFAAREQKPLSIDLFRCSAKFSHVKQEQLRAVTTENSATTT